MKTNLVRFFEILVVFVTAFGFTQVSAEDSQKDSQVEAFRKNQTVELPPFIVSGDNQHNKSNEKRWQYVSVLGIEAISKGNDWETIEFVETVAKRDMELGEIIPNLTTPPESMILITPRMYKEMKKDIEVAMKSKTSSNWGIIPQIVLWGSESIGAVYELDGRGYSEISLTPEYVKEMILRRTPVLPLWFKEGIYSIYKEVKWSKDEVVIPALIQNWPTTSAIDSRNGKIEIPVDVIPMEKFFDWSPDAKNQDYKSLHLWLMQSEVFLRWAFDDRSHARRAALWKFVDASSREPVTEKLFQQCFGLSFSMMERELTSFIHKAEKESIWLFNTNSIKCPKISNIRDATAVEVARIKGSFDLKEINYIVENAPQYVDQYIGQAEADLLPLYEKGVRDPDFLKIWSEFEQIKTAQTKTKQSTVVAGSD